VRAAANSAVSALSVISAGNGQLNPAVVSRLNVNRTVDGATPTRRAISLSPTPAVLKRSTSRTWRIVVLSAGIRSPVQKPKERTLIGPAETPINRATSSWIRGRLPPESASRARSLSPPHVVGAERTVIAGNPDQAHISTSMIERQNLTMRMSMRRFTRLTNAFSKKIENLRAAVSLHFAHYNSCAYIGAFESRQRWKRV
jgi:hypothetical protein